MFSRDQPERRYVQHRLLECAATIKDWVADGAAIYVMKDEQNECGAALLGPEDNIVQFDFEPGTAAVSAAQVQTGQTWCDFSAPVIAEANKKLGWAK